MDLNKLLSMQEKCINDNPPSCITECPLHVDVKAFIGEIQKGTFEEAYKILSKRIPFANIIGMICDHPCEKNCVTSKDGDAISIHELERAAVSYGKNAKLRILKLPRNNKSVAIIGGGISGLTCAYDLDQKGYRVVIFEKENTIGGSLLNISQEILDSSLIQDELSQFKKLGIEIKLSRKISSNEIDTLSKEYDAVFIGAGTLSESLSFDKLTLQTQIKNVFVGGKLITNSASVIQSVFTGRCAATSIDRYVQGKSMTALRETEGAYKSKLIDCSEIGRIQKLKTIKASDIYSKEEAISEASRCIQCECHKCVKACKHLQKVKLDPKAYIRTINQNERIILGDHYANKIINSCNMCGLCSAACPTSLNMADIIRETRQSMVQRGKMPQSAHDFAIKDMNFTNSKYFELIKYEPGHENSNYVFFPGCQLSASYSEYVIKSYNYLRAKLSGGVGLYLGCCGAPADWAGQSELFNATMEKIKTNLEKMGSPTVIAACSTCYNNLTHELKDFKVKSLWEIFDEQGLPSEAKDGEGKVLMVHDACTTRKEKGIHESIRNIAERLNYKIEEPYFTKETTKCCGYGGNVFFSNRQFSKEVSKDRIEESKNDFLVYCAMCRDLFVLSGKPSFHILDLLFGSSKRQISDMKVPTLSQRQSNRLWLKKYMLENLWGERMEISIEFDDIKIIMDEELRNKIDEQMILDSDIKAVIYNAEKTKNCFYNSKNSHILAFNRSINMTFWVEYEKTEDGYRIITAYSHRMEVTGV